VRSFFMVIPLCEIPEGNPICDNLLTTNCTVRE
jgi:hypothetical protein